MHLSTEQLFRFFGSVRIANAGCWLTESDRMINGYARFSINNGKKLAHRISYQFFKGEIPDKMVVMHSCDTRNCINPDHLSLGTAQDNTLDMHAKGRAYRPTERKTHCKYGHEYTPDNTSYVRGGQRCKTCNRNYAKSQKEARKAGVAAVPLGNRELCARGHVFEGNTYFRRTGGRVCIICKRASEARKYASKLAQKKLDKGEGVVAHLTFTYTNQDLLLHSAIAN